MGSGGFRREWCEPHHRSLPRAHANISARQPALARWDQESVTQGSNADRRRARVATTARLFTVCRTRQLRRVSLTVFSRLVLPRYRPQHHIPEIDDCTALGCSRSEAAVAGRLSRRAPSGARARCSGSSAPAPNAGRGRTSSSRLGRTSRGGSQRRGTTPSRRPSRLQRANHLRARAPPRVRLLVVQLAAVLRSPEPSEQRLEREPLQHLACREDDVKVRKKLQFPRFAGGRAETLRQATTQRAAASHGPADA